MTEPIIITGHKNPDTDSVVSAIAYADFMTKKGSKAVPVRLGDFSKETQFVLERFDVDPPEKVKNIHTCVKDLSLDSAASVRAQDTIFTAWNKMRSEAVKAVAVVDNVNHLLGVIALSDIADRYMDVTQENLLSKSSTPFKNIREMLEAEVLAGDADVSTVKGKVVVGAMTPEKLKKSVGVGDVVVLGDDEKSQMTAFEKGAACVIVTSDAKVSGAVRDKASSHGSCVISTSKDTFQTVRLINQSVPVSALMSDEDILSFHQDEYLVAARKRMASTRFITYPVVDASNKVLGFVSRYHLLNPPRPKVILVDHNERSQSVEGVEDAEILEIVDHHRVGDVESSSPIRFINDPVGATATIIAELYFSEQVALDPSTAGILLSAILSDTVKFTSPTATERDKDATFKLASIADVNVDSWALEMFKVATSIEGKSPADLFMQDFKEYEVSNLKIGIAQIQTMDFDTLAVMKKRILSYMDEKALAEKYDVLALVLTNVIDGNSEILFTGDSGYIIREAFNISKGVQEAFLEGVVSRKKQIVPVISRNVE